MWATVINTGRTAVVAVRAPREIVTVVAKDLDLPAPEFTGALYGYSFPRSRVRDVVAALEFRGCRVRLSTSRRRDTAPDGWRRS